MTPNYQILSKTERKILAFFKARGVAYAAQALRFTGATRRLIDRMVANGFLVAAPSPGRANMLKPAAEIRNLGKGDAYNRGFSDADNDRPCLFYQKGDQFLTRSDDPGADDWSQEERGAYMRGYEDSEEADGIR